MTDPKQNLNPFVLPGMGQSGESASNPLFASMEMMRQAMSGLATVGRLSAAPSMSPTLDPEELDRRIQELKVVENWLKLNLSMLSSTIQGMEVQLATISTIQAFVGSGPASSSFRQATPTSQDKSPATEQEQAAPPAAKAWWDMLEKQFKQVAAATAATLTPRQEASPPPKPASKARKSSSASNSQSARQPKARKTSP